MSSIGAGQRVLNLHRTTGTEVNGLPYDGALLWLFSGVTVTQQRESSSKWDDQSISSSGSRLPGMPARGVHSRDPTATSCLP